MQVLAIDLGIEVLPSLALGLEPPESGTMMRPPRSRKERLFDSSTILKSLLLGGFASILAIAVCIRTWTLGGWTWGQELSYVDPLYLKGTTMTFAGIVAAQIGSVLLLRARQPSTSDGFKDSRWIFLGIAGQLAATSAIIYIPTLQQIFGTVGIGVADWSLLLAFPIAIALISQAAKVYSKGKRARGK